MFLLKWRMKKMKTEEKAKNKVKELFEEDLKKVITSILDKPYETPEQFFKYKKDITINDFVDWFEKTELYYNLGKRFIAQEEGSCCSVDKAYSRYLTPECKKVFNIISKQAGKQAIRNFKEEKDKWNQKSLI